MSRQLFREKLILSKKGGREVSISEDFAPHLTPFQRDAIRFLCRQFYKRHPGVMVCSPSGRGKTAAATLLLEALRPTLRPLASLVLCRPERLDHWLRHLRRWTKSALETLEQSDNILLKKELFLCPLSSTANLARREWGIIVVDEPIESLNMQQLLPLKAKYKIWLTNSNLGENLPLLGLVCQWFNPKEKLDVKLFEKKGLNVKEQAEKDIALDIFCQDILFRSTSDCLPLVDEVPLNSIATVVVDQSGSIKDDSNTGVNEITRKNKDATGLKIKRSRIPETKIINSDLVMPHNQEVREIFDDNLSKIPRLGKNIEGNQRDDAISTTTQGGCISVNHHKLNIDNHRINEIDVVKTPFKKDKPADNAETDKISQKNITASQGNALIEKMSCSDLQNDCNGIQYLKKNCKSPVEVEMIADNELSQRTKHLKASLKKVEELANKQFKGSFLDSLL